MKLMSPKNFNPKQSSPRHVITKLSKTEDKDFKTSKRKKKKSLMQGNFPVDFSAETLQARREWDAKGC